MFFRLLLLFVLFAAAELTILVWLAQQMGFLATALLIMTTGVLGASLTRWQGLRAWRAIQNDLASGRMPAQSVVSGALVLVAGSFLLTPGLLSDTLGFLLLVPQIRTLTGRRLTGWLKGRVGMRFESFVARPDGFSTGDVIDAEFRRADARPIENRTHQ